METGEATNWADIFFSLHKYCHLNKWEIWEYTLPQIAELMKSTSKHIQFEVEVRMMPFKAFTGGTTEDGTETEDEETNSKDYEVATENDLMSLAKILGGGI